MPLDFMASESQKSINEKTSVFSLSENAHDILLSIAKPKKDFPKIHKFSDYYSDTSILFGEIKPLIIEIENAIKTGKPNSDELNNLIKFLNKTYDENLNLYIYCD